MSLGQKILLIFTGLLILLTLPFYSYRIYNKTDYSDFDVYYKASQRLQAEHWSKIYNTSEDERSPFRYMPATLPVLKPLAFLSHPMSRLIWFFFQIFFYSAGFFYLYRILLLLAVPPLRALGIVSFSVLYVFRFCLDAFTIGQVSSLMFFGFAYSLEGFLKNSPLQSSAGLFIPALFKLSPTFLFLLFLRRGWAYFSKNCFFAILFLLTLFACNAIDVNSLSQISALWKGWMEVVRLDSHYFDAAHYGSQSLLSTLLRLADLGMFSRPTAYQISNVLLILGCTSVLFLWFSQKKYSKKLDANLFCLGIFIYLWFMPETFKYSQSMIAIPVAVLLAGRPGVLNYFILLFGALTLSLAGLDLIGGSLFFWIQKNSIPFFAITLLSVPFFREALKSKAEILKPVTLTAHHLKGLTADDWGLSPGVNDGILALAKQGILHRVSILANSDFLTYRLDELLQIAHLQLGLHFNLTYGFPLSSSMTFLNPSRWLWTWLASFGTKKTMLTITITEELKCQIKKLKSLNISIQYADGHHHIHLLPGLIRHLAPILKQASITQLRLPYDSSLWFSSKLALLVLSVLAKRDFKKFGFTFSPCFYPKHSFFLNVETLKAKLLSLPPGTEIITHPAARADTHTVPMPDPYSEGRVLEFQALEKLIFPSPKS